MESQEPLENQDKSLQKSLGGEQKLLGKLWLSRKFHLWIWFWALLALTSLVVYTPAYIAESTHLSLIVILWPSLVLNSFFLLREYLKERSGRIEHKGIYTLLVVLMILGFLATLPIVIYALLHAYSNR